jgi:hypothetical protein
LAAKAVATETPSPSILDAKNFETFAMGVAVFKSLAPRLGLVAVWSDAIAT